jgi:hypothetical protein
MTTAKWTSVQERSTIHAIFLQDLMKRGKGVFADGVVWRCSKGFSESD